MPMAILPYMPIQIVGAVLAPLGAYVRPFDFYMAK